jgi:hypothetical protein
MRPLQHPDGARRRVFDWPIDNAVSYFYRRPPHLMGKAVAMFVSQGLNNDTDSKAHENLAEAQ